MSRLRLSRSMTVLAGAAMALGLMTALTAAGTPAMAAGNPSHIKSAASAYTFQVVNYNSDKCLDVTGRSTADGAIIQQWSCIYGAPNQAWNFYSAGGNYYTVVNINSHKCLDVTGGSTADGAIVQQWSCNGRTNQEWYAKGLYSYGGGEMYNLINLNSGKCLDVWGRSTADGAVIQQWSCNAGTNQQWFLSTS